MTGQTFFIKSTTRAQGSRFAAVATNGTRTLRAEADTLEAAEAARRSLVTTLTGGEGK